MIYVVASRLDSLESKDFRLLNFLEFEYFSIDLDKFKHIEYVLATSKNAIKTLPPLSLKGKKALAIGASTSKRLESLGARVIFEARNNALALASFAFGLDSKVLYLKGEKTAFNLEEFFTKKKQNLISLVAYKSKVISKNPYAYEFKKNDCFIFGSPKQVDAFFSFYRLELEFKNSFFSSFALGESTYKKLQSLGICAKISLDSKWSIF